MDQARSINNSKEIEIVKRKADRILIEVESFRIINDSQMEYARGFLKRIVDTKKAVKEKKETMTKPFNEGLRNLRNFFAPMENNLKEAEDGIKTKMIEYKQKMDEKAVARKKMITEKVENGDISFKAGSKQIEKVENKIKAVPSRTIRDIEIVNEKEIPSRYWIIDMVQLRKDALSGIKIPGAKVIERQIIVAN